MVPEDQVHLYKTLWSRVDQGDQSLYTGAGAGMNRQYLQDQYTAALRTQNPSPPVDWIGWHKDVEMDDIKLKYIEHLGKDLYDHDLYQKQSRAMARKPYLDGADEFLYNAPPIHRNDVMNDLTSLNRWGGHSAYPNDFSVYQSYGVQTDAQLYYNDDRELDIIDRLQRLMGR